MSRVRLPLPLAATCAGLMLAGCDWIGSGATAHEEAQQQMLRGHRDGEPLVLGSIDFSTTASGEAQREFITGVLALHSFWYPEARDHFRRAQELDPSFGLAYWGEAMSYDNALGTMREASDNEALGAAVVSRMDALDAKGALEWTELGEGFAAAVRERFKPGLSISQRRDTYSNAMRVLAQQFPDNDEVTAFTALSIMAQPSFNLQNPDHVVALAARLEQIYDRNRDHPGVLHYLIHLYDTPTFALMGLRQARLYAELAPASSHALHMPSHIFRHLGMWNEVAASNEDAYAASVIWQERTGRPLHMRDYHAMDWLMDAYLQLGRYEDADALVDELNEVEAQIEERGEGWGEFREIADAIRTAARQRSPGVSPMGH